MKIFFRNIPSDTHSKELSQFIKPSLDNGILSIFRATGEITKINIFAQKDKDSNIVRHHGLITIENDKVARRTIKRLHKTPFKGRIIIIREFVHRSFQKDRRNYSQGNVTPLNTRRRKDRREHSLETVTHFGVTFTGQTGFARKLGY